MESSIRKKSNQIPEKNPKKQEFFDESEVKK